MWDICFACQLIMTSYLCCWHFYVQKFCIIWFAGTFLCSEVCIIWFAGTFLCPEVCIIWFAGSFLCPEVCIIWFAGTFLCPEVCNISFAGTFFCPEVCIIWFAGTFLMSRSLYYLICFIGLLILFSTYCHWVGTWVMYWVCRPVLNMKNASHDTKDILRFIKYFRDVLCCKLLHKKRQ